MQKLTNILFSNRKLTPLQGQLQMQQALLQRVQESLPSPLDQHCFGAIPRGDTLILLVESPAWASRMRYLGRELLQQLQRRRIRFRRIQVRVSISRQPVPRKTISRRARPLSRENAQLLQALAESLDDDRLKSALQRLSRHSQG